MCEYTKFGANWTRQSRMTELIIIFLLLIIVALVFFIFKERNISKQQEEKLRDLQLRFDSSSFESIQHKLNPHLFKNALNSIQSHAYQTYYSLDKLANVLDYILYGSDSKFVTLEEELDFAYNLIEINRLKLTPLFDLQIKNKIDKSDPVYNQLLIAPLLSVDLIENAFKHTDFQSSNSFISIVFDLKDGCFILTVSNKAGRSPALRKEKGGFGKESLKKRLAITYADRHTLDESLDGDVYIARLKIQLSGQTT